MKLKVLYLAFQQPKEILEFQRSLVPKLVYRGKLSRSGGTPYFCLVRLSNGELDGKTYWMRPETPNDFAKESVEWLFTAWLREHRSVKETCAIWSTPSEFNLNLFD